MILPLICVLKQVILDQTEQNGYQTVPFDVCIHNLVFVSHLVCVLKMVEVRC